MVSSVVLPTRVLVAAALFLATVGGQRDTASAQTAERADSRKADASGLIIQGSPDSQRADTSGLIFHQSVRRVVVDVVVSDSKGKPVSGLTADDFSITEDGKAQHVRSFDIHDFDSISDSLPPFPTSLPTNTFVNVPAGPERGPLYVLLLDLLNMEVDDQPAAREQLLKFARSKPLGTRFAIFVLSDGLYLLQGFTEDRNRLADVVDPKNSRDHLPRIFLYADNYRPAISTPRVLMNIARFLADLPGHKNVIWISASFPSAIMPSADPGTESVSINDEIKEATDTLARGQIAVYPVDVRGVVATGVSASDVGVPSQASSGSSADYAVNARHMTEQEIADATGGRAFYNTNDVAAALTEATETGGHYYTVTYSPSNQTYNGRMRHIHVDLAKRGYHLAYRRSYYGNPDSTTSEAPREMRLASELEPFQVARPADSLYPNMQHGAPLAHQLLFRAHIHALAPPAKATPTQMASLADQPAYFRERRQNRPAKPLRPIQLQTYEIDYTVAARYPALEIAAAAFDADGKMVNGVVQRVVEDSAQVLAEPRREAIYRLQQQFDVPLAAVSLRLAVRDVATDNVSALEINLPLAPEGQTTDASLHPNVPSADAADPAKLR
jgi:VWFA-related protein